MSEKRQHEFARMRRIATCVAVLAFVLLTVTELAHVHKAAPGKSNLSHCSLCVAAHSVASPTAIADANIVLQAAPATHPDQAQPESRFLLSDFFIRPPPAAL